MPAERNAPRYSIAEDSSTPPSSPPPFGTPPPRPHRHRKQPRLIARKKKIKEAFDAIPLDANTYFIIKLKHGRGFGITAVKGIFVHCHALHYPGFKSHRSEAEVSEWLGRDDWKTDYGMWRLMEGRGKKFEGLITANLYEDITRDGDLDLEEW